MKPIISVRNLSKRYHIHRIREAGRATLRESLAEALSGPLRRLSGREPSNVETLWALRDVSFDVEPGEVVGLIGRKGTGKSTLLKILARITRPTSGEVDVYGRVGSLLQLGAGFHRDLTGRENIFLNGMILGMRYAEIKRKFDEIVAFAEIEQFLDTPVKQYSSGMYVRLAFSVAAHVEPEVLLLDEVTAVGDSAFQKKCFEKMREVSRKGRTVLFVSHNLSSLRQMCRRVPYVRSGRLREDGDAESVLDKYSAEVSLPDR